jgi:Uma2 family endonuclease
MVPRGASVSGFLGVAGNRLCGVESRAGCRRDATGYAALVTQRSEPWLMDPDDPRAPAQEVWDRMSERERQLVVDSLPSEFPPSEAHPPEGDQHTEAVYDARTALRRFFGKLGRSIYVGTNLPVYYPGRSMFSPDVMAVLDVPTHSRSSWLVSKEGKGLDLALEVVVLGARRKDLKRNVEEYARLGIREYFVFDRPRLQLTGNRLRDGGESYQPIVPQRGCLASEVLGLELRVEAERLRFYLADAELPAADDLIAKLEGALGNLEQRALAAEERAEEAARRAEEEARRAEEEARRAEEEARRAEAAEARLREALAELERLKR